MSLPETKRRETAPPCDLSTGASDDLYETLYFADSWFAVARVLHHDLGLTKSELARATGVTTVTVTRWLDAHDQDVRTPDGLNDLRFVVLAMLKEGGMTPKLLRFWLCAKDVELGTDALTAIRDGRFEEVIEAGRALTSLRRPRARGTTVRGAVEC